MCCDKVSRIPIPFEAQYEGQKTQPPSKEARLEKLGQSLLEGAAHSLTNDTFGDPSLFTFAVKELFKKGEGQDKVFELVSRFFLLPKPQSQEGITILGKAYLNILKMCFAHGKMDVVDTLVAKIFELNHLETLRRFGDFLSRSSDYSPTIDIAIQRWELAVQILPRYFEIDNSSLQQDFIRNYTSSVCCLVRYFNKNKQQKELGRVLDSL